MKIIVAGIFIFCCVYSLPAQVNKGTIHIAYNPGYPVNSFIPSKNIGGALDGHEKGDMDKMLTSANLKTMLSVGLKPVSYRLRTELGGEVWHWNPKGNWSEADKQQGYWVSDSTSAKPIKVSYGYRLRRRGNTRDQANDDGYSMLADGNTTTFWKSNPYLDEYYTKEPNALHPQWIIVDLGELKEVNAIKINWGNPYALSYTVDYAPDIGSGYFEPYQPSLWHSFPKNLIQNPNGKNEVRKVSEHPIKVRFVRISMERGSYTPADESKDIRAKLGFAVKEMKVGVIDARGDFHDWMKHAADHNKQSMMHVSSTDPWHRAEDLDENVEQVGIDRFFTCGITDGQPVLMPAGLLYDTPENVIALLKYLRAKSYPVEEIEMGEEPEGQLVAPVDYAALYYQWATQIRSVAPGMRMGGPGYATLAFTKDEAGSFTEATWTNLFLEYLKKHEAIDLFNFFSFEWYPFDNICSATVPQLTEAPQRLSIAIRNIRKSILPPNTPMYVTEYGYSAYGGKPEVEIEGALMYADILGKFLELGGSKSFLYGYEPAYLEQTNGCDFGNNILFGLADNGRIMYKTAAYWGMQMLTHYWAQPSDGRAEMYPATCNLLNKEKQPIVSTYAIKDNKGKWSLMLINKDPERTFNVNIIVDNVVSKSKSLFHPSRSIQYSKRQYHWFNNGSKGHPSLNLPPVLRKLNGSPEVSLPPYSLTILNQ